MALYAKQDFSPPILSRKWIAMRFRPNMLIYARHNIILILESGLLFREDSIEVEQETADAREMWTIAGGGRTGWLTGGERIASIAAVCACVALFPLELAGRARGNILRLATYASLPVAIRVTHRSMCRGSLPTLLGRMRDYLTLARRAAACLRECAALRADLGSVSSLLSSLHTMLCRQQRSLTRGMARASAALLGNAPWLRGDLLWGAVVSDPEDDLMKIHHAFLVVQSTLLKHIAMAHYIPSVNARKLYKNHNERIYWIHHTLIKDLIEELTENYECLERMYRLLKNYGTAEVSNNKKLGAAIKTSWLYGDVHSDIVRANLELKLALNKCNDLDAFLDSCALNNQEIDLNILSKDIDNLVGTITKSLSSAQSSQIRLKKLLNKFTVSEKETHKEIESFENEKILKIDDREPEAKDEVFYFIKTDADSSPIQPSDVTTGPGKLEMEATEIVLNELRRKLVSREDTMRERERQALVKTNPEFKNNVPEFPRQINLDKYVERKGYITKLPRKERKKRLFRKYKIRANSHAKRKQYKLKNDSYDTEKDIKASVYEANEKLNKKNRKLTFAKHKNLLDIIEWHRSSPKADFSDLSDGLSDVEHEAKNKNLNETVNLNNNYRENGDTRNYRFSKKDLELSPSSDSESDSSSCKEQQMALLKDLRKYRACRKKNYVNSKATASSSSDKVLDEGLRPVEYSFGAGLAMASVLQINSAVRPNLPQEEIFVGDGELSEDSGNDGDN